MAASKQASKHTHARAQCSPASVGLAQARPNKSTSTPLLGEVLECKIESGNLQQLLHDLRTSSPLKIFVNGFLLDGFLLRHPVCSKVQKIRT